VGWGTVQETGKRTVIGILSTTGRGRGTVLYLSAWQDALLLVGPAAMTGAMSMEGVMAHLMNGYLHILACIKRVVAAAGAKQNCYVHTPYICMYGVCMYRFSFWNILMAIGAIVEL
jgi:hypothetical protein